MDSPLFTALRSGDILMDDHEGGCVLYEKRELVEALINKNVSGVLVEFPPDKPYKVYAFP